MLVLAETAIGFVVFKLSSDAKLDNKDLWKAFETPEGANKAYVFLASPHHPVLMALSVQPKSPGHTAIHFHRDRR